MQADRASVDPTEPGRGALCDLELHLAHAHRVEIVVECAVDVVPLPADSEVAGRARLVLEPRPTRAWNCHECHSLEEVVERNAALGSGQASRFGRRDPQSGRIDVKDIRVRRMWGAVASRRP